MRIALDATYSLGRNLSGVGVYSRELLWGIARAHPEADCLFCYRPHRFLPSFADSLPRNARRRLLRSGGPVACDLFHALNQRVDSPRYRRTIATFHDLFVLTGDYSAAEFRRRFAEQARLAAERSAIVIAVSHFTARQVETLLKVDPARIRVVHHGVRPPVIANETSPEREPMILFVGAIQRRKNIARLVEAFERTAAGWKLTLAGSAGFGSEEILGRIDRSPRRGDIALPGYVEAAELERLYRRASVFAFPSLDEGFGMPVLEAMSRGLPVLTSNVSALPEVAGDAALLVDPANVDSIADGLNRLTVDESLRGELAQKGRKRSAEFTWEGTVERTWAAYRELLD